MKIKEIVNILMGSDEPGLDSMDKVWDMLKSFPSYEEFKKYLHSIEGGLTFKLFISTNGVPVTSKTISKDNFLKLMISSNVVVIDTYVWGLLIKSPLFITFFNPTLKYQLIMWGHLGTLNNFFNTIILTDAFEEPKNKVLEPYKVIVKQQGIVTAMIVGDEEN